MLGTPTSERQFIMYEALRKDVDIETLYHITHIKPWFIEQMKELVELEEQILTHKGRIPPDDLLIQAKKDGFADKYLAHLLDVREKDVRKKRTSLGMVEAWEPVSGQRSGKCGLLFFNL